MWREQSTKYCIQRNLVSIYKKHVRCSTQSIHLDPFTKKMTNEFVISFYLYFSFPQTSIEGEFPKMQQQKMYLPKTFYLCSKITFIISWTLEQIGDNVLKVLATFIIPSIKIIMLYFAPFAPFHHTHIYLLWFYQS